MHSFDSIWIITSIEGDNHSYYAALMSNHDRARYIALSCNSRRLLVMYFAECSAASRVCRFEAPENFHLAMHKLIFESRDELEELRSNYIAIQVTGNCPVERDFN
jgi:hypothetical protein